MFLAALFITSLWNLVLYNVGMAYAAKATGLPAPMVFGIGLGPTMARFCYGRTEFRLGAILGGGYCTFAEDIYENEKLAYLGVVLGGPCTTLLAGAMITYVGMLGGIDILDRPGAVVVDVRPQIGDAGLRPDDVVLSANGKPIRWGKDLALCLAEWQSGTMTLDCERAGEVIVVELRREEGEPREGLLTTRSLTVSRWATPAECLAELPNLWWQSVRRTYGWYQAIVGTNWSNTDAPGVGDVLPSSDQNRLRGMLLFFGLYGVHLSVFNLLPIPCFVGFTAVRLAYEIISRSTVAESVITVLTYIGLAVMLVVMSWIYWGLISSLWKQPPCWNTFRAKYESSAISVRL